MVRYSPAGGAQRALEVHHDGSAVSFVISLSPLAAYEGGGTWVERSGRVYRPAQGSGIAFSATERHAGLSVTKGVRYILAGFLRVGTPDGCDD